MCMYMCVNSNVRDVTVIQSVKIYNGDAIGK